MLVVDDDGANRLLAVRWLDRVGIAALEAENGEEALNILNGSPQTIGAVILDVVMPAMTGYDVLERIQASAALRDIPVVMLTAHVQQEADVLYGLRNGAVDHLAKPFRGPILAAKIQSLVELRQVKENGVWQQAPDGSRADVDLASKVHVGDVFWHGVKDEVFGKHRAGSP